MRSWHSRWSESQRVFDSMSDSRRSAFFSICRVRSEFRLSGFETSLANVSAASSASDRSEVTMSFRPRQFAPVL